jgi:phosphoribosylformimino-5-aminoimidazole carboxamide ribonucleotide (ProFAR) isomerase
VIASGGIAGPDDIAALAARPEGIEGAIIGRALYEGKIDAAAARDAARRVER